MTADSRPAFPWPWLLPSIALLIAMGTWGAMAYPELPELVPKHIGPGGVDAWSRKSVGAVFVLPLTYLGMTLLLGGCAFGAARTVPESELPRDRVPGMVKRPATRASAARTAKAVLVLNAACGVSFLPLCAVMWRTEQTSAVAPWLLPVVLGLIAAGLLPVILVALRDRAEKAKLQAQG
ncbi:DUF1648 domain-containing protein [Bounagaea algeriensis]